ncbi:hypothetical protein Gohar_027159 [Gossypium harknessii]|uniref:Uncharacterized protein n=1 Tax=Gossypium harknessii TaxID=34285 RepID=A0A7J9HTU3_9ROSI|nr:hypothetical protein [Gossypium harknessii]
MSVEGGSAPLGEVFEVLSNMNLVPQQWKVLSLGGFCPPLWRAVYGLRRGAPRPYVNVRPPTKGNELTELKKTLNVEVEQLRSEFQELRNTLHHQQEDVTASLRNLGKLEFAPRLNHFELLQLQDVSEGAKEAEDPKVKLEGKDEETLTSPIKENGNEVNI